MKSLHDTGASRTTQLRRLLGGGLLLVALAVGGCATTEAAKTDAEPVDPAVAAKALERAEWTAAKTVVKSVLNALSGRDESAFKALLSQERKAAYTRDYYELWVRETDAGRSHRPEGFEKGRSDDAASVIVAFRTGNSTERVAVRLVKEDGQWRWDER